MTSNWLFCATATALALVAPQGAAADNNSVIFWNQVMTQNVTGNPVVTSRFFSMTDVAIFEALNASTGNTRASYLGVAANPGNGDAAVARAARDVMLAIIPTANAAQRTAVETQYQNALAAIPDNAAKTAGINNGALSAAAVIALRSSDGSGVVSSYTPTGGPGRYVLTGAGAPVTPQWGGVTPWGLASGSQFRPDAPPPIDSAAFADALAVVRDIGQNSSMSRTGFQSQSATYWATAGTGLSPWINAAITSADGRGLSTLDYAAMFASLATNVADATIGVFDAKYFYDFWRPTTAINTLYPGAAWTSFIAAPLHPSYISGHSGISGAAAVTLGYYLGDNTGICFTGFTCFDNFQLAANNAKDSRLWGGIHYSFDNDAGLALGQNVASYNLTTRALFQAVPEPGSWLLMLLGFGVIGWSMRRRQAAPIRAPARPASGCR